MTTESIQPDCTICDGSGEVYRPSGVPDGDPWEPCLACIDGKRRTDQQVYDLALAFEAAKGDLQGLEFEIEMLRAEK